MTIRQITYLLLSVIGLLSTWIFNIQWMSEAHPGGMIGFFEAGYINAATSSLTNDLIVVFLAFCIWVIGESRRLEMKFSWAWPFLALFIALAFAFPLFLFLRDRRLQAKAVSTVVS